jgi:hypothetical protein
LCGSAVWRKFTASTHNTKTNKTQGQRLRLQTQTRNTAFDLRSPIATSSEKNAAGGVIETACDCFFVSLVVVSSDGE